MWSTVVLVLMFIFFGGLFYLRLRFIGNNFRKASRLIQNSTPLIHSLLDYAQKIGVREIKVVGNIFAENQLFPRPQSKFWLSNTLLKEITVPVKEVISLLENKHYAMFELYLAHEIGHQIIGIEKQNLREDCGLNNFFCLFNEILAWRKALEIIQELSGGIEKWEPKISGEKATSAEVLNFIDNVLSMQCGSCKKLIDAKTCPKTDVIRAIRIHIKTILKIKAQDKS